MIGEKILYTHDSPYSASEGAKVLSSPRLRQSEGVISSSTVHSTVEKGLTADSQLMGPDLLLQQTSSILHNITVHQGCDSEVQGVRLCKRKQHQRDLFPYSVSMDPVSSSNTANAIVSSQSNMTISNHHVPFTPNKGHKVDTRKICSHNDDSTRNVSKSPGLYRKVTEEMAEIYRYTPKQFAPIANNQSYLFAVEDKSDAGALQDMGNIDDDNKIGEHTPLIGPPSSLKQSASCTKKTRRRPSLTPIWKKQMSRSRKLSRYSVITFKHIA